MLFYEKKAMPMLLLPDRFHSVAEFKHICDAVGNEIDSANKLIAASADNTSIALATEQGLIRWEKILGVSTPLNSTLDARREALLAKLITKAPINMVVLENIIEAYMGVNVEMSIYGYSVDIAYRGKSRIDDLTPLYVTIYNIIPANMIANIRYKYIIWSELDGLGLSFNDLDTLGLKWDELEKGAWING